jgi:hypothetical protein
MYYNYSTQAIYASEGQVRQQCDRDKHYICYGSIERWNIKIRTIYLLQARPTYKADILKAKKTENRRLQQEVGNLYSEKVTRLSETFQYHPRLIEGHLLID